MKFNTLAIKYTIMLTFNLEHISSASQNSIVTIQITSAENIKVTAKRYAL